MPTTLICTYCQTPFTYPGQSIRKYCSQKCYHSDPSIIHGPRAYSLDEALWPRVEKSEDHWLWVGAVGSNGYGVTTYRNHPKSVHRAAWELASGKPIPKGYCVLHICDHKLCVRNDEPGDYEVGGVLLPRFGHLCLGTAGQNNLDRDVKDRRNGKLCRDQVIAIRSRKSIGGVTNAQLAQEYGVTSPYISAVANRRVWRRV